VAAVEDGYETSTLPERLKLAVRFADVLVIDPKAMTAALQEALAAEFTPAEIVELAATITMASGFSKAAIAWGPPPHIPVTEVPTPTPGGKVG
jgi:alkylhydroperoxidase family enzyme